MILGGMKKKPMFGGDMGYGASMPGGYDMQDGANLGASAEQRRPGLGTRLFGEGWEGKAGALGGLLLGNPFAVQQYQGQQQALRQRAEQLAAAQRAEAQRMAAAGRLGIGQDEATLLGDNIGSVVANRMKGPEPVTPGSFEWFQTATPEQIAQFRQYSDARQPDEPRMISLPDGRTVFGTMSEIQQMLGGQSAAPTSPVGRLTPIEPTIENTPPPQLGSNGLPTSLTRAQYQAVEQRMGKADTAAWAQRNNIRVVN